MRLGVAIIALLLLAPAARAQDLGIPADALGARGDQHVDYPPWQSQTHAAPSMTVGSVGDVNGDGLEDFAAGFSGNWSEESVYVTYSSRLPVVGGVLGFGGIRIRTSWFWFGVASAGDVNGDGFGDVAIMHTSKVVVVFGRPDSVTVDADDLGSHGFTITGVGQSVGRGSEIYFNNGIVPMGDLDGDGVPDLLVAAHREAAIVHPPRDVAGTTIDASAPGPRVSRIRATANALDVAYVGRLGDVDGDGRDDVMFAGEEVSGIDQVGYGVRTPPPGTLVELPAAVDGGQAFELRTHDGEDGWYGELEAALTIGDQNGDGVRELAMLGTPEHLRLLRVAFPPPFGTRADIHDLRAYDPKRGYAVRAYSDVIDVGDQNGDGRSDIATSSYVYFTDPEKETGSNEPAGRGFSFSFADSSGTVAAPIADLNGDGKPELAVARVKRTENGAPGDWRGENATYAVDVFDSAKAPVVQLPELPVALPDGGVEVPVAVAPGAGARGGTSLAIKPRLELQTQAGAPVPGADGGVVAATDRLALRSAAPLQKGAEYRARYSVANGRGLADTGPWRSFTHGSAPATVQPPKPVARGVVRRGTRRGEKLVGTKYADRLDGRGGDDRIIGLGGADRLLGGSGRDRIDARDGVRDVVDCGKGRDFVRADRKDRLKRCERRRF